MSTFTHILVCKEYYCDALYTSLVTQSTLCPRECLIVCDKTRQLEGIYQLWQIPWSGWSAHYYQIGWFSFDICIMLDSIWTWILPARSSGYTCGTNVEKLSLYCIGVWYHRVDCLQHFCDGHHVMFQEISHLPCTDT